MVAVRFDATSKINTAYIHSVEEKVQAAVLKALHKVWGQAVAIIIKERYDTGAMAGSTGIRLTGATKGIVQSTEYYSLFQHEGFKHYLSGKFVPGVPWFELATRNVWPQFQRDVKHAVRGN